MSEPAGSMKSISGLSGMGVTPPAPKSCKSTLPAVCPNTPNLPCAEHLPSPLSNHWQAHKNLKKDKCRDSSGVEVSEHREAMYSWGHAHRCRHARVSPQQRQWHQAPNHVTAARIGRPVLQGVTAGPTCRARISLSSAFARSLELAP